MAAPKIINHLGAARGGRLPSKQFSGQIHDLLFCECPWHTSHTGLAHLLSRCHSQIPPGPSRFQREVIHSNGVWQVPSSDAWLCFQWQGLSLTANPQVPCWSEEGKSWDGQMTYQGPSNPRWDDSEMSWTEPGTSRLDTWLLVPFQPLIHWVILGKSLSLPGSQCPPWHVKRLGWIISNDTSSSDKQALRFKKQANSFLGKNQAPIL